MVGNSTLTIDPPPSTETRVYVSVSLDKVYSSSVVLFVRVPDVQENPFFLVFFDKVSTTISHLPLLVRRLFTLIEVLCFVSLLTEGGREVYLSKTGRKFWVEYEEETIRSF